MISIIIPTFNEESHIRATIQSVWMHDKQNLVSEIIVSDGGSIDNTLAYAVTEGVRVVTCPAKGRAAQMNFGASFATGSILYFLHADTTPPPGFTTEISKAVLAGKLAGCFLLSFDYDHWFLTANCWFTRFDIDAIRFGDQSLFVAKELFVSLQGYNEKMIVLEDQELIKRIKTNSRFKIINKPVQSSARKYIENGIYKTQAIFFLIYTMYRFGFTQEKLVYTYKKLIRENKL
jgi:rSAM/selenodomain-associated transferase 2